MNRAEGDAVSTFEGDVIRERPQAAVLVLTGLLYALVAVQLALCFVYFSHVGRGGHHTNVAFNALLIGAGPLSNLIRRRRALPRRDRVRLRIDESGLTVDGSRVVARTDIVRGSLESRSDGGVCAALVTRDAFGQEENRRFVLDEPGAAQLLEAAGVTVAQRAFRYRAAPATGIQVGLSLAMVFAGLLFFLGAPLMGWSFSLGPAVAFLGTFGALVALWRTARPEIAIGLDGIQIGGVQAPRFIPWSEIQSAKAVAATKSRAAFVELATADGRKIPLRPPSNREFGTSDLDALVRRIDEARALAPTGTRLDEARALLTRGNRSIPEWLASVRALGALGRDDYRTTALDADDLGALVADGSLDPEARAGAAIALRSSPGRDGARRVRVAAAACVASGLRICLDAIAENGDDDAITKQLSALKT